MIRVLEIGDFAAPDAGRTLVGLGADVTIVEPAGGAPERRADPVGFAHRAGGKSAATAADAAALAPSCDVILDGTLGDPSTADIAADLVRAAGPGVVHIVLTPYGDAGPASGWQATDLTVAAAGGMLALVGRPDRPPLRPYGDQAVQLAGVNAAIAALLAVRAGGGQRVVVSAQASVAASLEFGAITYIHTGRVPPRTGSTHPLAPHTLFATADGVIAGGLGGSPRMFDALLGWLVETGDAGDLADERWQDAHYRVVHREEIFQRLAKIVRDRDRDRLFHEGQARRLPWAAVLRPDELTGNAQLQDRGFFAELVTGSGPVVDVGFAARVRGAEPPEPLRVPEPDSRPTREGTARRRRAASGNTRGALDGLRVLDLTWVLAGPYATKTLADHGAEVIKIESRHRPDPTRFSTGFHLSRSADADPDTSGYFNNVNRNKKSITLNLRTEEGRDLALRLAAHCDLVVENFAAGVLDRLGLGYERLRAARPDIVVVSMSGMGHTGPWRDYVSYADAVSALSGWTGLTGEPGEPPVGVVYGLADIIAGHHAALAAIAALDVRDRTGEGQHVDLAQLETAAAHLGDAIARVGFGERVEPIGNRHPRMSPHGVFPCLGDDTWVAIAARDDDDFARLLAATGLPGDPSWTTLPGRREHEDEIERRLSAWTKSRPAESVAETLQRHGIPAYAVRDGRTLVEHDEALRAWDFYRPLDHPASGTFLHEGLPVRMARAPGGVTAPAPRLGEHTAGVLTDLLGLSTAEQDALRTAGVLE
ncbi:CoA transferase [Actinomadura syzygii]|uniref:CaiB/BaiF CoA-transferase family protein n=1 Tax=Actinomadura syzygii TaxID=1427538 RepID=UPI001CA34D4D|nr:CoA transferase [Actinomadura syzygii]